MLKKFIEQMRLKAIARQLRKPNGAMGHKVARKMNEANEFLYDFTLDEMLIADNHSILEIGFGNGKFFDKLLKKADNLKITGIDFSDSMVKSAKENNPAAIADGRLTLTKGKSDNLPFAKNSFDRIFCINVAYFWDEPDKHLQEIHRVLKPEGKFCTTVRTKESMQYMPFTRYGFRGYTEDDWKLLSHKNNLTYINGVLVNEPPIEHEGSTVRTQSLCFITEKKS